MMRWIVGLLLSIVCSTISIPPPIAWKPEPVKTALKRPHADDRCLAWVLWSEARGEPLEGARAVYDVIHTRMKIRKLSACQVVRQKFQFSGYKPGMTLKVDENAWDRLTKVRQMKPVASGAEYFHATYVQPIWAVEMKRIKQVGNHIFLRKPKEKK